MVNYEKYENINWKECYKYYINIDFDCILKILLYRHGFLRLIKSESPHDEL